MKKLASIGFLAAAAVVFLFAACDGDAADEPVAEESDTPALEVKTDDVDIKANEDTISIKTP